MRRWLVTLALAAVALLGGPAIGSAPAHPLGNFTINRLTQVRISTDRIDLRYILDEAEIPTFQARDTPASEQLDAIRAELRRGLRVTVDGASVPLTVRPGATLDLRPGQGGLKTTRVEVALSAPARDGGRVVVRDETYADRQGWKALIVEPGRGTDVRSTVPSGDPTDGLRRYPQDVLESPPDERVARFTVTPGDGAVAAPRARGGEVVTTGGHSSGDGFAQIFADAAAGKGVLLFLLLAAFGWGALHALSPGHGKAMVAAYLVGTRGSSRDAVALGAVVTISHTIGVFALGLVTLLLAQYILPEDLYPWLNIVSGLLVVAIGGTILWRRVQAARGDHHGHHDHHHHHHHHGHDHHHHHHAPGTLRGILGLGAAAGLIPCPSALVVLLAAVSQQQIALGLLLIVVFSVGLAATLTALGLAVVHAGRLTSRLDIPVVVTRTLPALSALVIVAAGAMLTLRALPGVV